jgi:chemotaxis protein histidine kinase CheA
MSRNDDGFNLDDMMEIFGDAVAAPSKAPVATAPAAVHAPAPASAAVKAQQSEGLTGEELALLEAYEKQKHEKHQREEEARRKKDQDAKRILEDYEKAQAQAREKEERERAAHSAKREKELEELKRKEEFQLNAQKMAEEEAKIIEEFEREAQAQKERQEAERKAKEAAAQAELQRLAEQQKAEASRRQAEDAQREDQLRVQAESVSKKDSRLLELLAKAQQDLQAPSLPPLPGGGAADPAAAPSGPSAADVLLDIEQKENDAFCSMLDETRKAMFTFLAPLIGIKAATNMLTKTVEKARAKAPVVLKDANWKMDGSLRDDGSVDNERLLKNVGSLPALGRVNGYLAGLRELVGLRLKAVEAGLGATTAGEMHNRVLATREHFGGKPWPKEWVDLFYQEVVG